MGTHNRPLYVNQEMYVNQQGVPIKLFANNWQLHLNSQAYKYHHDIVNKLASYSNLHENYQKVRLLTTEPHALQGQSLRSICV